jgi:hypothetical protein
MNLNGASEQELTQLPRIGVDKARRIVHYRAIRRGFRDWADFACTPGITEADVEAIRTRAWIGPLAEESGTATARRRSSRGPKGETASTARFWRWASGSGAVRGSRKRAP